MSDISNSMLTSLTITMVLLIVVYLIVIAVGFLNVDTFLIKQGRYKNYFMISFYTMSQITLVTRLVEFCFFLAAFVLWIPDT